MATDGIKITALTSIAGADVASTDVVPVVDVSDTTQAVTGTTKKTTIAALATAVTAAGSLATDAEVTSAVSTHAGATDPHADRAFATSAVSTHVSATGAHDATKVSFTPIGIIGSTDVAGALGDLVAAAGGGAFGAIDGVLIKPWQWSDPIGPELWTTSNFQAGAGYQTATASPSITADGTNLSPVRTRAYIGSLAGAGICWRLTGTITTTLAGSSGWGTVTVKITDHTGTTMSGAVNQTLASHNGGNLVDHDFIFEFVAEPDWSVASSSYLELALQTWSNIASGTLSVSNVSLRQIPVIQRPMLYTSGNQNFAGTPHCFTQHLNPHNGLWQTVRHSFGADNALTNGLMYVSACATDKPWSGSLADPRFLRAEGGATGSTGTCSEVTTVAISSMRSNNNDQILEVLKEDGTTWELRGNTHAGETATATTFEVMDNDGDWSTWSTGTPAVVDLLKYCRRFRFTWATQMARSAPDSDTFATVSHVTNVYPDGMQRTDRTTTFTQDTTLRNVFEWMSSHDLAPQLGRIGRGLVTLEEVDTYAKVATPAAPTAATSDTGGYLAPATYRYVVTALAEGGETVASPAVTQVVPSGTSTNVVTLTLPTVTNATGFRIYGRTNSVAGATLLATLGPLATEWVDTGEAAQTGGYPPTKSTARRLNVTTAVTDIATSDTAGWSVWRDLRTGFCFGNIYDRDSVAQRDEVGTVRARIQSSADASIRKQYINLFWPNGTTSAVIPSGTVWTATHWAYAYLPQDLDRWEWEIAVRAAYLSQLNSLYPAT